MFLLKAITLFTLLLCASLQEHGKKKQASPPVATYTTIHQANLGKWKSIAQSKEQNFPQYFICGVNLNSFIYHQPYSCQVRARPFRDPVRITCKGGKPLWQRANGIKFRYCNFENWSDQKTSLFYGSWQWQNSRMCNYNQYVYSYSTRILETDGLNGILLNCKSRFNNQTSVIYIGGNKGVVRATPVKDLRPNQFAYDFHIKYHEQGESSYITGLNLVYTPFPQIADMQLAYDSVAPPQIHVEYETKLTVRANPNQVDLIFPDDQNLVIKSMIAKRQVEKKSHYEFSLTNFQYKYQGEQIKKYLSQNYTSIKLLLPQLIIKQQENIELDRMIKFRMNTVSDKFTFGRQYFQQIPKYEIFNYTIPKCYKLEIKSIIYSAVINNPYTLAITYQSGRFNFIRKIKGVYQGTVFSRPQAHANLKYYC